jgi:hypothetical protein
MYAAAREDNKKDMGHFTGEELLYAFKVLLGCPFSSTYHLQIVAEPSSTVQIYQRLMYGSNLEIRDRSSIRCGKFRTKSSDPLLVLVPRALPLFGGNLYLFECFSSERHRTRRNLNK